MEGTEENKGQEAQVGANAVIAGAENQGQTQEQNTDIQPTWQEQALIFAKENGREVSSFEELLKPVEVEVEKVVEKEVNPYAELLDDEDKAYFDYKKTTGKGRKEFDALNKNWDEADKLELARERVRKENGLPNLSNEDADNFISEQLGIDDLSDMTGNDQIKLSGYAKKIIDEKKAEQEQYRKPIENKQVQQQEPAQQPEYVKLPNGAVMEKAQYDAELDRQQKHTEAGVEAAKTVKTADFKMSVDDNGSVRDVAIPYEYSEKDTQEMVSMVSDLQGTIAKRYHSEDGSFKHAAFAEDMHWSNREFREKAIADIASKARAEAILEVMKRNGNHNFTPEKPLDKQTREGVRMVPFSQLGQ